MICHFQELEESFASVGKKFNPRDGDLPTSTSEIQFALTNLYTTTSTAKVQLLVILSQEESMLLSVIL